MLIAAYGNSFSAIIKHLEKLSEEEIVNVELGTVTPTTYDIDTQSQIIVTKSF